MGSPVQQQGHEPANAPISPETLARVVLRCRELTQFLEDARAQLPQRSETPFLFGQLDDVVQRLQASLRPLFVAESEPAEKSGGFLRRLTSKKPRENARKSEPRYDLEGNAWTIPVTELVGFLSHSGKSGLLWVTSTSETFVLEFARGSLVHATSNAPPVSCRLGEILLREKLLEPEELARLIDSAKAADDLLGSYLLRCGRLKPADLQRVLAIQVQQLFHRLMDADNALYRFQEGAQLLRSHSLEVNITHLLLESARKKDEERQRAEPAPTTGAGAPAEEGALAVLADPLTPQGSPEPQASEPAAALPAPSATEGAGAPGASPPPETSKAPAGPASS